MIKGKILVFAMILSLFMVVKGYGQGGVIVKKNGKQVPIMLNTITTAVPFLLIAPDSRSGGMGDAGVAISSDANATFWNPSKLAFADQELAFSLSYVPWLRQLVPDINLSYLSGYKKIDKNQTIGGSIKYFSLGSITFTTASGAPLQTFSPNELAVDLTYARKLSKQFSGALSLRYIYSNLTGGVAVAGTESQPGRSVAADISGFYRNDKMKISGKKALLAAGFNVSNIGMKMTYTNAGTRDFIPINLKIGSALTIEADDYNEFTFSLDFNKLLVPTPPIYKTDKDGVPIVDGDGKLVISSGKNPDVSVPTGIFSSFSDAPGTPAIDENNKIKYDNNGNIEILKGSIFKEELREINISSGLEYTYAKQFSVRTGYFHEHATKGNRKFYTLGAGLKYNIFSLDFSYLIAANQNNPLGNTLRFTLKLGFDSLKDAGSKNDNEIIPQ